MPKENKSTVVPTLYLHGRFISTDSDPGESGAIIGEVHADELVACAKELIRRSNSHEHLLAALMDIVEQAEKSKQRIPADLADSIRVFGKAAIAKAEKGGVR